MPPESPKQTNHQMKQIPPHTGILYKPTTECNRHSWNKHWPELNETSKRTRISWNESPDHQGQFKPFRLLKRRFPSSDKASLSQNTSLRICHRKQILLSTWCQSRTCSSTTSKINTTRTKSWGQSGASGLTEYPIGTANFKRL